MARALLVDGALSETADGLKSQDVLALLGGIPVMPIQCHVYHITVETVNNSGILSRGGRLERICNMNFTSR